MARGYPHDKNEPTSMKSEQSSNRPVNRTLSRSKARELRYLILAVQREGNRWLAEILRGQRLTPAQAEVLTVLSDNEPLTLSEIGQFLICENGSPSRLVAMLAQRGLVSEASHATDRRAKLFSLTDSGRVALKGVREIESAIDTLIDGLLSGEEQQAIGDGLRKILHGTALETTILRRFGTSSD